jgi:hypothetical protein
MVTVGGSYSDVYVYYQVSWRYFIMFTFRFCGGGGGGGSYFDVYVLLSGFVEVVVAVGDILFLSLCFIIWFHEGGGGGCNYSDVYLFRLRGCGGGGRR